MSKEDFSDYYDLLGIDVSSSTKEISKAYRKMAMSCHPDKHPDDPTADTRFDALTKAKDILIDPIKRSEYDRKLKSRLQMKEKREKMNKEQREMTDNLLQKELQAKQKQQEKMMYKMDKDQTILIDIRRRNEEYKEKLFGKQSKENDIQSNITKTRIFPERYYDINYGKLTLERLKKEVERRNALKNI
ncbi:hypothetical protein WA158_001723 [Blastocystis sp. Blastoise]